jgi:D-proline reductase (dithiol) PrdB
VGLIQRKVEAAGIATISISLSKEITRKINLPRAIYPGLPLGHPLGLPGQTFRQLQILRMLLHYLHQIDTPGTIIDLDLSQSDDPQIHCAVCGL